jgi:hypothetical protein
LLLLFLSDGKPSDKPWQGFGSPHSYEHKAMRDEQFSSVTGRLAARFGRRLTVGTIAFGPPDEDFSVLRAIASASTLYNSTGIFQKPTLNAHSLRMALSTLSTTLTATKTEMTELGGSAQRVVRDVLREPQSAGNETCVNDSWYTSSGVDNHVAWSARSNDWVSLNSFVSPGAVTVAVRRNIFGEGAERMVRKFREVNASGVFVGLPMVAKESRFLEDMAFKDRREFHRVFCQTQHQAQVLALEFNTRLAAVPGVDSSTPRITFLACSIYILNEGVGYLVEEMIDPARYKKFNSNNGYVDGVSAADVPAAAPNALPGPAATAVALGAIVEESDEEGEEASDDESASMQALPPPAVVSISAADIPQAFSHFSYLFSKRKMMVCDLQGVLDAACSPPVFKLTDPVIHYSSSRGRTNVFGRTDRGRKGMTSFFKTHKCSELCRMLNRTWVRPEPRPRPSATIGDVLAAALARMGIVGD